MDRLKGKVCLITGGGRGLGKAMAIAFANEGAKAIAISYVSNEAYAEETCEAIIKTGSTAYMTPVEVTDRESIKSWVNHIIDAEGQIDVLVNNAGINRQAPIDTVTEEDWTRPEVFPVTLPCSVPFAPQTHLRCLGQIVLQGVTGSCSRWLNGAMLHASPFRQSQ